MNATEAEIPALVKRWILGQEPNMIQVILDLDLYPIYPKRPLIDGPPAIGRPDHVRPEATLNI